jgi:phage/plasmid primase-like uncharacterized protein
MVDLRPFKSQIKRAMDAQPCADPRGAFLNLLHQSGYACGNDIALDEIKRIDSPSDKKNQKSGWYIYREIPQDDGGVTGIGYFGCWKEGVTHNWQSKLDHLMTTAERLAFHSTREAMRKKIDDERRAINESAAQTAFGIWQGSPSIIKHGYLTRKGVDVSDGLKMAQDGRLIIPVTANKQIISLQYIAEDGTKRFLKGGKTAGGYYVIEGNGDRIFIAEGYATAKSLAMATGSAAYCAFSCHNMFETALAAKAENPNSLIVIAGDHGNGSKDAKNAAQSMGCEVIFTPDERCKDFNDYHAAYGLDGLAKLFDVDKEQAYEKPKVKAQDNKLPAPTGFIADCYNYYNAVSGIEQKGWALQTALAIGSLVCGRGFKTDYNNFASIYFICVGKSGTGKETPKTVIENVLSASNMQMYIGGDGYTASGAVFSMLLDAPKHITVIDEFGRYLEAGKEGNGTHNQREANTTIMEAFSRCHSVIRPKAYSSMTAGKEAKAALKNRHVYNPAITLLGMTTPDTFFNAIDKGAIKDGFINRFIISISDAERQVRRHAPYVPVPERLTDWVHIIQDRYGRAHSASEPAEPITLEFTNEAYEAQIEFQEFCIEQANALERFGMAEITGRSNEIAMRLSLICALSDNPNAEIIELRHMNWAIEYVKFYLLKIIKPFKMKMSGSDFEAQKKAVLSALRDAGAEGVTWRDMMKNEPFSALKPADLKSILSALKDAELAANEPHTTKTGKVTELWIALK